MTTLAVLGAGVKAVAVAAKAYVLGQMGVDAPEVVAVEPPEAGQRERGDHPHATGHRRDGRGPRERAPPSG